MTSKNNIYNPENSTTPMANTLVSLRISQDLLKESKVIAKEKGFSNTQEFIREAIRARVEEYRRQKIIEEANRLYGIAKGKKIKTLTRKERDALARSP
jgi:metal-responsive CopG/Arc/MetJ family transcriptional regulator